MGIGLQPGRVEEYQQLHREVRPDVRRMIRDCDLRNHSIYLRPLDDGQPYLFSSIESTGEDFAADRAKIAADPTTRRGWACCQPCPQPLAGRAPGEWWSGMPEVFHSDCHRRPRGVWRIIA